MHISAHDCIHIHLSKSTDHEMIHCSIYGGGQLRDLDYTYKGFAWEIVWDPNKGLIDLWRFSAREVLLYAMHSIQWNLYMHIYPCTHTYIYIYIYIYTYAEHHQH